MTENNEVIIIKVIIRLKREKYIKIMNEELEEKNKIKVKEN